MYFVIVDNGISFNAILSNDGTRVGNAWVYVYIRNCMLPGSIVHNASGARDKRKIKHRNYESIGEIKSNKLIFVSNTNHVKIVFFLIS